VSYFNFPTGVPLLNSILKVTQSVLPYGLQFFFGLSFSTEDTAFPTLLFLFFLFIATTIAGRSAVPAASRLNSRLLLVQGRKVTHESGHCVPLIIFHFETGLFPLMATTSSPLFRSGLLLGKR